jgi:hypothetical protein
LTSACRIALSIVLTFILIGQASAAEWAPLSGRFVVGDDAPASQRRDGLRNAVIILRTKDVPISPSYAATARGEVILTYKDYAFEPVVLLMRTTQTLKFVNDGDRVCHAKIESSLEVPWSGLLLPGMSLTWRASIAKPLPIKISDAIDSRPKAWLVVRDTPYVAVSAFDGTFTMPDLPVGIELEFYCWHAETGRLTNIAYSGGKLDDRASLKQTIKPGGNDIGEIVVPEELLAK